jgi:hypothetical protein
MNISSRQLRFLISCNAAFHFAVRREPHQGLEQNYCVSAAAGQDLRFLIPILAQSGVRAECLGLPNYLRVYGALVPLTEVQQRRRELESQLSKLQIKAFRMLPQSPRQLAVIEQINELNRQIAAL